MNVMSMFTSISSTKSTFSNRFVYLRFDMDTSVASCRNEKELRDVNCDSDFDDNPDDWKDEETSVERTKCLFCAVQFASTNDVFTHCNKEHAFNILQVKQILHLDCFAYIKLINYIRRKLPNPDELCESNEFQRKLWGDGDEFMIPESPEDALLWFDIEQDLPSMFPDLFVDVQQRGANQTTESQTVTLTLSEYNALLAEVRSSNQRASQAISRLEVSLSDQEKLRCLLKNICPVEENPKMARSPNEEEEEEEDEDSYYFQSYDHHGIHGEMLKDTVRTLAYRDAILMNESLFANKTILDIGCGTSILSIFAAKAGAGKVLAVDQSEIVYKAMDIVKQNDLDHVVQCLKGKVEEVSLPSSEVEIIISEWMGYFLLFESMLDSVIWARDRYLNKSSGRMLPDRCNMYLGGFEDVGMVEERIGFWDDVYGVKMTCMKSSILSEADVTVLKAESVLTDIYTIKSLDLMTCQLSDLDFNSAFSLLPARDGQLTGFFGYFDTIFDLPNKVSFTTSPLSSPTHWKQTLFLLEHPVQVSKGRPVEGEIVCRRSSKDKRSLDVTIKFQGKKMKYFLC